MADAGDLKSSGDFTSCGFDSHPGHFLEGRPGPQQFAPTECGVLPPKPETNPCALSRGNTVAMFLVFAVSGANRRTGVRRLKKAALRSVGFVVILVFAKNPMSRLEK